MQRLTFLFYSWCLSPFWVNDKQIHKLIHSLGNAENVIANLDLSEEYSNNYNLSLEINELNNDYGSWKTGTNLFIRDVEDAIILMTVNNGSQYHNVSSVDSKGFQVSGTWTSVEDFLSIEANYTTFDLINTADKGLFAQFKNERIPNRPHTFFNTKVGLKWTSIFSGYDELRLKWNYRFVDRFDLFWDSHKSAQSKIVIPVQESHGVAAIYTKDIYSYTVSLAAEIQNVTNEKLYDHYGVQRPGRAFSLKTVVEF